MARRGNLKVVDIRTYRHPKTGREVQIKFDPNQDDFYANYAEIEHRALKIGELEKLLEVAMVKNNKIAWSAGIEVELEQVGVGVKYDRFLIGDVEGEYPDDKFKPVNRETLVEGVKVMAEKYPERFAEMVEERDDADTGDCLLQCTVFGEQIFG